MSNKAQSPADGWGCLPRKEFWKRNGEVHFGRLGMWQDRYINRHGKIVYAKMHWHAMHLFRHHVTHIVSGCGMRRKLNAQVGKPAIYSDNYRVVEKYETLKYIKVYSTQEFMKYVDEHPTRICGKCFGIGKVVKVKGRAYNYLNEASDKEIGDIKKMFLPNWENYGK